MTRPESFPIGYSSSGDIAQNAKGIRDRNEAKGYRMSPQVAVALAIQENGISIIKKMTTFLVDQKALSSDINSIIEKMDDNKKSHFFLGLAGVFLGSAIKSLGDGAMDGWKDNFFIENFNNAITGTPVPRLTLEMFYKVSADQLTSEQAEVFIKEQQETEAIRGELRKTNSSFVGFFDPSHQEKLPRIMSSFLEKQPSLKRDIGLLMSIYKEAVEKLPKS